MTDPASPLAAKSDPDEIDIVVPADAPFVRVRDVVAGEVWTFVADGRWVDGWIGCAPDGYRNFLADVLSIRPRASAHPWFCLMGSVDGKDPFPIGRGVTTTFKAAGTLTVCANDADGRTGNNKGAIRLRGRPGGLEPVPEQPGGIVGAWQSTRNLYSKTLGIPFAAALAIGACGILAAAPQGQDLLRTAAEDTIWSAGFAGLRLVGFAVTLLFLAIQVWFWSRTVIDSNYGLNRDTWRPKPLLVWGPRVIGLMPFVLVIVALVAAGDQSVIFIGCLVVLGLLFFAFVIWRQDALNHVRGRRKAQRAKAGIETDEPPWPFGRRWALFSFGLAAVAMVVATLAPVAFGVILGAPSVVFLALGLIIPVMVTVIQAGAALRLPVTTVLVVSAALFSLRMDNHAVARRGFLGPPPALPTGGRIDLATAYGLWKAAQPQEAGKPKQPLTMVLVASEGGASRAGFWTAEVLGRLHEQSGGRFATHLFAINSVSGGSVGAVGYTAVLHDQPSPDPSNVRLPLEAFAGADALGPVMTGLLFPDLVQRFLPLAVLPDRAAAIERAWESAWSGSCALRTPACRDPDLLGKPFLTLGPTAGQPWSPLIIVQGASEETGRRILTTKLAFNVQDIDADDFYVLTGRDVPISTAIHNGARFPYVSPTGTLTGRLKPQGHIVDGGYFDAAGVETVRELAQAVERVKAPGDDLRFVFVFIGYQEATQDAQPTDGVPTAGAPKRMTKHFLNEGLAPLVALLRSRDAHGAHLMRDLEERALPPGSRDVDPFEPAENAGVAYVPVILCDRPRSEKEQALTIPLDWALSKRARDYMADATGYNAATGSPGCGCEPGGHHCTRAAIERIVELVGKGP